MEKIEKSQPILIEEDGSEVIHATASQEAVELLSEMCDSRKLKINKKKTQLLTMS